MIRVFEKESRIEAPAERVFAWHERPEALAKLIPPGAPVRVIEHIGGIRDGARVVLAMGYPPFTIRWVAVHQNYVPGHQFEDVQTQGPMRFWRHTHTVLGDGPSACILRDHVEYELPFSPFSEIAGHLVRRQLEKMFKYRHGVTAREVS